MLRLAQEVAHYDFGFLQEAPGSDSLVQPRYLTSFTIEQHAACAPVRAGLSPVCSASRITEFQLPAEA